METLIANRPVEVNEQGYLLDMDQWDKEIAKEIAAEEEIELTDRHFEILQYLREEQVKGTALTIRRIGKSGIVDIKEFYQLFPGGPLKRASRIAGIPKPASCI
ncbi:TusE/DsrC/DsvC family sulfur relay protein [Ekhidna sp. To15]|uniref:TusE/DsrC/DsvC family sulfur relay protein n=1 Tax=Ekhidna sp. To15 TaxID=3395267 RepID=UPI003F51E868